MTSYAAAAVLAALLVVPAAASAQQAYTAKTVNLRAGPDRDYPLVARLPPGVLVEVHGCVDGYTWCDVSVGPDEGWVYAGNLSTPYQDRRVPLIGYGAVIGLPIVVFSLNSFWDNHYRGRPWYHERSRWENRPPRFRPPGAPGRPGMRPPPTRPPPPGMRPPGVRPPVDARPPERPHPPGARPMPRPGGPGEAGSPGRPGRPGGPGHVGGPGRPGGPGHAGGHGGPGRPGGPGPRPERP